MVMCFVPDCKHYNQRHDCRFFRFPKDEIVKKIWIINIRRGDRSPSKHSVVCSCHFTDGKKENKPTIFNRNEKKMTSELHENLLKTPTLENEAGLPSSASEVEYDVYLLIGPI